jgi:hypothetical protein
MLIFPFADLSVKAEGEFVLRFRVFNLLAVESAEEEQPMLSECVSKPFRVYGAKSFPGVCVERDIRRQHVR